MSDELNFDCKVCEGCQKAMTAKAYFEHACQTGTFLKTPPMLLSTPLSTNNGQAEKVDKGGRPKGFDGRRSKMPSAMAQAFKRAGLDWQVDFALAIKANNRNRIKLWLKLLPYLITTSSKSKGKKWKGKPSKAALIALETLEDRND